MFVNKAAARRTADLYGLEFLVADNSSAYIVHDLPYGDSHGDLDKARVLDFSGKGKNFCAL